MTNRVGRGRFSPYWRIGIIALSYTSESLRASLRGATARAHDLLDGSMRAAAGWTTRADYARFLALQYAARMPVEAWLIQNAPHDICPPAQCALIAADLAAMGKQLPQSAAPFEFTSAGDDADQADFGALGAAWVLAGSSLGNRAIRAELHRAAKAEGGAPWPDSFLGDERMLAFWKHLRDRIENPADHVATQSACRAAVAVFDHFIAITMTETTPA